MGADANKLNAEDKFAKTLNDLRRFRPFYSAIYESLERIEDNDKPTMGVNSRHMVYNSKFVESLDFKEFMFVNLHEIAHVALMHVSRRGKRDPEIWNIAADLYVNALLSQEFSIYPNEEDIQRQVRFLNNSLFCSSVDLNLDTTESIYDAILDCMKKQGFTDSTTDIGKEFEIIYRGSKERPSWCADARTDKYWDFKLKVKVNGNAGGDIIDGDSEDQNKRLLYEASVRSQMRKSKEADNNEGLLESMVNELIKSHIDWKKLLRKYCIRTTSSDSNFSNPDRRMFYQNAIYPGQMTDESNRIRGVKICFDSSGSISLEDIARYFGQVQQLLTQFRIEADVLYWDTNIATLGSIHSIKDITENPILGGGGTDPSCIFEYFDSKRCKIKPIVTLIFTDGYIIDLNTNAKCSKWKKKYKDTIWVMTKDGDTEFNPPFGIVTYAKYSE